MSWLQFHLATTPEHTGYLEDLLLEIGAVSVTLVDAEDSPIFEPNLGTTPLWNRTQIQALFPENTCSKTLLSHLKLLSHIPIENFHFESVEEQDWVRRCMDDFHPMQFGERLWVVPSWHTPPDPKAVNLYLDPGLAFGTGTHPTTTLCLQWLDHQNIAKKHLLDFGCGSGILAIAGLLLGADQAVGIDIDPQALESSKSNTLRNNVDSTRFSFYLPKDAPKNKLYDIGIANILSEPLIALADTISRQIKSGGKLALSGILLDQVSLVKNAYENHFILDPIAEQGDWALISGTKR